MMQVKAVVWVRVISSGINLFFMLVLVYFFKLLGFFISLLISTIWTSILLFYFIRSRGKLKFTKISLMDLVARNLMTFGGITLLLSIINLGSQYLQRIIIIHKMDISSVGIFQAAVSLMAYIGLINQGSIFYFFPKMSEAMSDNERVVQINNYIFFVLFMSILICVTSVLFASWGIQLMYSDRFLPLASYFFWFVLAQFLSNMGIASQFTLVGTARLGMHTISVIAIHLLYVLIPLLWIEKYGIASLGVGFVVGQLLGMLLNFGYLRYRIGFRFTSRSIWLFILGIVGIIISKLCVDDNVLSRLVILVVITGAISLFLKQEERLAMVRIVRNKLRGVLSAKK
jgi:O-antigen/teichoic acid export membrane protein